MNTDIQSTLKQCSTLTLQLNLGEQHRIMRNSIKIGSLWVTPRKSCYRVAITGEVETLLGSFMSGQFGAETGVHQGRRYWNIQDIGDVAKVIRRFDEG